MAAQKDSMHVNIPLDSIENLGFIQDLGISYDKHLEINNLIRLVVYKGTENVFSGKCYSKTQYSNIVVCSVYKQGNALEKTEWYTNGSLKGTFNSHFGRIKEWYPSGMLLREYNKSDGLGFTIEYYENGKIKSKIVSDISKGYDECQYTESFYEDGSRQGHRKYWKNGKWKDKGYYANGKIKFKEKKKKTLFGKSKRVRKTYSEMKSRSVENYSISKSINLDERVRTKTFVIKKDGKLVLKTTKSGLNIFP